MQQESVMAATVGEGVTLGTTRYVFNTRNVKILLLICQEQIINL